MKCEKCGKNMANYHYRSNINGKVTEMHLCQDCANKSEEATGLFEGAESMFEDMLGSFFGSRHSVFGSSSFLSPFESFGSMPRLGLLMPTMFMPRIELYIDDPSETEKKEEPKKAETDSIDPEMEKRRKINELREQMKKAVEAEEFETAAKLRDEIKTLG